MGLAILSTTLAPSPIPGAFMTLPTLHQIQNILVQMAPGMPHQFWWLTASVIIILVLTSIAVFATRFPDFLLLSGLLAVIAVEGVFSSWKSSGEHLLQACAAGVFVVAIRFAWKAKIRYDTLAFRSAEWTALAVACFGILPLVYAWGVGVVLSCVLMLMLGLVNVRKGDVTFLPFLLIGLGVGLYSVRFW